MLKVNRRELKADGVKIVPVAIGFLLNADYLENFGRYQCTVIGAVTPVFQALLASPRLNETDFSKLRLITSGGACLPVKIRDFRPAYKAKQDYGLLSTRTGFSIIICF